LNFIALDQKTILKTGLFGAFMGIITTLGWAMNLELILLILMLIASSVIIKKNISRQIFTHCILIGLIWGVDCTTIQALFYDDLINNNPNYKLEILKNLFISAPLILILTGLMSGIICGLILWGIQKIIRT
tara:strand:+ start:122 stop:514 length:393 start_codon:yes stop_codon:yes gene_type:complete